MKKACIYVNPFFVRDGVFSEDDPFLNRDNQLEPFRELRKAFLAKGYELRTQDFHSPEESEFTIFIDMPKGPIPKNACERGFLLLMEPELIRPDNWVTRKHRRFYKILTWSEQHLKDSRYAKINYPQPLPAPRPQVPFAKREKLCCLIAGGKLSLHPQELYSERIRWIRWFEKNHPNDFNFYGAGWKRMWMTGPLWIRAINKIPFWRKLLFGHFPSYRGPVDKKLDTLSQYKFSICLENAEGFAGYITEKIFDCFFAGNVPLYLGAPDIAEKIPSNCFIDLRKYDSFEDAYNFMTSMSESEYEGYQKRIEAFLQSDQFKTFSTEQFVSTIVSQCLS